MKQTAVEWLADKLSQTNTDIYLHMNQLELSKSYFKELIDQAKAMEKEQIKDAWLNSLTKGDYNSAEQYYNETYEKNI